MSRNGSGIYNLPSGQPVVTGTTISSTTFNTLTTDLANALTTSIASDGQTAMSANLPMGGNKLTGLGAATIAGDAARYEQIGALALTQGVQPAGSYAASGANSDITSLLQSTITSSTTASAGGTSDAIAASFTPVITTQTALMTLYVRAVSANTTTTPTFTPNSGTVSATVIVKGNGLALVAGDIAGIGHILCLQRDAVNSTWVLQNPAFAVSAVLAKQIQSVAASVASSALTCTLNPTSLDFRSPTLGSGATNSRIVASAISLVVPSTATLGTVSGVQSRLVLLALDNAGVVELAIINIAGGTSLDETGLIGTTALSATATSAFVAYSTTARTNVTFRVVGFVDSTQATAGTWATAPSTVQGTGGQALAALSSLGYGQTWQNVTASRATGTTYYNTSARPIYALVCTGSSGASLVVNGITSVAITAYSTLTFIVPPNTSYQISGTLNTGISWLELR